MTTRKTPIFTRDATGLVREIRLRDAFGMNVSMFNIAVASAIAFALGPYLFPGSNMGEVVLFALPIGILFGLVYAFLGVAMPRSGGDYVWVSRILGPPLGFMTNFLVVIFFGMALLGSQPQWITTFAIPILTNFWGSQFNLPALTSFGQWIVKPLGAAITGTVVLIVISLTSTANIRTLSRVMFWMFVVTTIGTPFLTFGLLSIADNGQFVTAFNSYAMMHGMNTTYTAVINSAQSDGASILSHSLLAASISAIPLGFFFYGGTSSPYLGGEVKNPNLSMPVTIIGAYVMSGLSMFALAIEVYRVFGYQFTSAAAYLFFSGASNNPIPLPPSIYYLTAILYPNPFLVGFLVIVLILGDVLLSFVTILLITRSMFAWGFDRILSARLASVSTRTHTPILTPVIAALGGIISVWIYNYTTVFSLVINAVLGYGIAFAIVGVAAAAFPFVKKDIFESAPKPVNVRIGKVPLISIIGILEAVVISYVLYLSYVTPALAQGPTSIGALSVVIGVAVVGLLIYYVSLLYNRKKGIDLRLALSEIPPE